MNQYGKENLIKHLLSINEAVYGKEILIKKLQKMNITQFPSLRKCSHRTKNRS